MEPAGEHPPKIRQTAMGVAVCAGLIIQPIIQMR